MKAEELRIGNFVNNNIHGIGCITAMSVNDILYDRNYDSLPVNEFQPIPLTEEWLLELGLNKIVERKPDLDCSIIEQIEYLHKYNGWTIRVRFIEGKTLIHIWNDITRVNISEEIYYVNQLQNLYYALTGEELTMTQQ